MGIQVAHRISFQQTHDTIRGLSYVCFWLILQANPCFVLVCGIRVASMSNVDSIPFPKRCSHIYMGVLILLDHQDCHANSFPTDMLLFKWIRSFSTFIRSLLGFLQRCLFHPSQVVFVFLALPPFFFKDSDFLIKYPFYSCEVSSFFSINVLTRWFS